MHRWTGIAAFEHTLTPLYRARNTCQMRVQHQAQRRWRTAAARGLYGTGVCVERGELPHDSIHPELSTSMHDERLLRPAAQTRQREQSKRKHVRATMAIGAWPAPELPYRAVSGVRCRARGGWRGTYIKGACAGLAPSNLPVSRLPALTRFFADPAYLLTYCITL